MVQNNSWGRMCLWCMVALFCSKSLLPWQHPAALLLLPKLIQYKYRPNFPTTLNAMLYQPKWVQSSHKARHHTLSHAYTPSGTHKSPNVSKSVRKPISCSMAPLAITTAAASYLHDLIYSSCYTFLCSTGDLASVVVICSIETQPPSANTQYISYCKQLIMTL